MRVLLFILTLLIAQMGLGQINFDKAQSLHGQMSFAGSYSPDGKYLVAGSGKHLNIFFSGSGNPEKTVVTEFPLINGIYFVDSENFAVIGTSSNLKPTPEIHYFNVNGNSVKKQQIANENLKVKKISIIGRKMDAYCVLTNEGDLLMINDSANQQEAIYDAPVVDFSYSNGTKVMYIATADGKIVSKDLSTKEVKTIVNSVEEEITGLQVSLDEKTVAYATKKSGLYFAHEKNEYTPLRLDSKDANGQFLSLNFSYDNQYMATVNGFHIQVWSRENNNLVAEKKIKKKGPLTSIYFDPKGKFLSIGGINSSKLDLWNCLGLNISPFIEYKDETDKAPPQVVLTNPKVPKDKVTVTEEEITLQGLVVDNMGVQEVRVNGKKASLSATGDFEVKMNLAIGENKVVIEATDINNNTAIKKVSIIRKEFDLESLNFEAKNYILAISIDKYTHWPQLNNAVYDADNFIGILQEKYGFDSTNVILVQDTMANRQGILDGFKDLIGKVGPNDNVIIYYSGHGYFDPELGEGYWIPYDAQKGQDADYLPNSFMMQLMKKVNSKHMFLVADACFSGSLFSDSHRGYTENVGSYKSRWGLASGRLEYVSDGASGEHSPFNKYLVEYLRANEKETFSVSELIQYVKINVANETNQAPIGNPLGGLGDEGGEFIFTIEK